MRGRRLQRVLKKGDSSIFLSCPAWRRLHSLAELVAANERLATKEVKALRELPVGEAHTLGGGHGGAVVTRVRSSNLASWYKEEVLTIAFVQARGASWIRLVQLHHDFTTLGFKVIATLGRESFVMLYITPAYESSTPEQDHEFYATYNRLAHPERIELALELRHLARSLRDGEVKLTSPPTTVPASPEIELNLPDEPLSAARTRWAEWVDWVENEVILGRIQGVQATCEPGQIALTARRVAR